MNWPTRLTKLLNLQYPIIQAPMLGVTSPEMVATIANLGGLGSLPLGTLSPEKTLELIKKTKALTSKPFAVNLFTFDAGPVDPKSAEAMQNYLLKLADRNNVQFEKLKIDTMKFHTYKEQIDIILDQNIPIVSFTFGVPDDDIIKKLKSKNITLIGTATCVKEAKILDAKGVDAITAQGIEAGGHRGTFLHDEPLPQVGSMSLIPLIVDNTSKPVLASGGINDGRTIRAAFALGASGVQIGTAFLGADESVAIPAYKELLSKCSDTDTTLTRAFSGRWARGIKNQFMEEVEKEGITVPDYPVQNSLTGPIRAVSQKKNNNQFTNMWAGQSVQKCARKPSAEIFKELVKQAENV